MTESVSPLPEDHVGPGTDDTPVPGPPARRRPPRTMLLAGVAALIVGVLLGLYVGGLGRDAAPAPAVLPTGHPAIATAKATPTPTPVMASEIAELTTRASGTPTDLSAVRTLVSRYVAAFDWANASLWQHKLVSATPDDTDARLVLGVYQFNAADLDGAERTFLQVTSRKPDSAEAYYNLGFLYLQSSPPAPAKAAAAWRRVVALAPGSEMAQWVEPQVDALAPSLGAPGVTATPGG